MKGLATFYPTLTADERARLFIAAAARRDYAELDRLNDTCPRGHYIAGDPDYARRKIGLMVTALAWSGRTQQAECGVIAALAMLLVAEDCGSDTAAIEEALAVQFRKHAAQEEAWRRFCADIGIDPEAIRQAYGIERNPLWAVVIQVAADFDIAAPDEAAIENHLEGLRGTWRSHVG